MTVPEEKREVNSTPDGQEAETGRWAWVQEKLMPVLMVLMAVGISVGLFVYRDRVEALGEYGYLGAFLISLIASATIILPVPGLVVLFAIATVLNPALVGLVGATGGIIGELTGFLFGYGGGRMLKKGKAYNTAERWMKRWGLWAVFFIAAAPLPLFDVAGVIAGVLHYPLWKFMLVGWVGKSIKYIIFVYAGALGWEFLLRWIG